MSLLSFVEWCERSALGTAIRDSYWAFPVIEAVHLLGLAVLGGAVLLVNLRLLGFGLRQQPVATLARAVQPWLAGSLMLMLLTGAGLFLSEPTRCYYSTPFWVKMASLILASVFTLTIWRRVTLAGDRHVGPMTGRLVALVSLALWFGVSASGRWIGFSG